MKFYKIADDQIIDLERVVDITIIDIPSQKGDIEYALLFEFNILDQVKMIPNRNLDEEERETSHTQTNEYFYLSRISESFSNMKLAEDELNKIIEFSKEK
jgi:hypothetical protein